MGCTHFVKLFIIKVTLSAFAIANFWFCNVFHFSSNAFWRLASASCVFTTPFTTTQIKI